jgi:peptide/nickel transport system permease protein
MLRQILRRFLYGILVLWIVSVLVFVVTEILPGDVATAILGQSATEESIEAIRKEMRLDRPPVDRYLEWFKGMARGDLGDSLVSDRPVVEVLQERLKNTIILALAAALFAVPLSIGLGLLAAMSPNGKFDRTICIGSLAVVSMPEFFTASFLVMIFAVKLRLLPATSYLGGYENLWVLGKKLILPVATLTGVILAHMLRMTRATILNVLNSTYIQMAILKGVPRRLLVLRHALPNSITPIINVIALNLAYLISGVVVIETVFAYPGLGKLLVDSVAQRDIPLCQAIIMLFCATYFILNLLADFISIFSNPRRRHPK